MATESSSNLVPNVTSEVGQLRAVMLHRPGKELDRLTPSNSTELLFDGLPWLSRAQEEHDAFADLLRSRDIEVLYVDKLLTETLDNDAARDDLIRHAVQRPTLGPTLAANLSSHLQSLAPEELTETLIGGLTHGEFRKSFGAGGLKDRVAAATDFVINPLPNVLFTRDSSFCVGDSVAITSLATPARLHESVITKTIFTHHTRLAGTRQVYTPGLEFIEGGDCLIMGDGVIAVGVGERTTVAGAERLAQQLFAVGIAKSVIAVPIPETRAMMHLDTVCTMVDKDAVVVYSGVRDQMQGFTMTPNEDNGIDVAEPEPFFTAAAKALELDELRVLDTSSDPVTDEREQWDDGNNTLAIAPGVVVTYERNEFTNSRMEAAGIEVLSIDGTQLGSGRGGPRCMSCPIVRDDLV